MKKALVLSLMFAGSILVLPTVEANAATVATSAEPQIRLQIGRNRNRRWNRTRRVVTTTRVTRVGRYRYRETIRTTYLPNGRTRTQIINRVRLGRAW